MTDDATPGPSAQERDAAHLREAVRLAMQGMRQRAGGPFGAVVVRPGEDGGDEVVGRGWNSVTSTDDPTAHAEVVALREAGARLGTFELTGTTIYASGEPCPMCWAACRWARVDRIVFANDRSAAAEIGFDDEFLYEELERSRDEQEVPMVHLPLEEGQRLYDAWAEDDSYTRY